MLAFPVLVLAVGLGVACADGCLDGVIQPGLTVVVIFVITLTTCAVHGAHRARPGAVAARARVRRGVPLAGRLATRRIIFREILPNLVAPIIVYARS